MYNDQVDYGFPSQRFWDFGLFEYRGLCSHNALLEGVRDAPLDMTPEQLEETDKKRKEHEREYAKMNNALQRPRTLEREAEALATKKYHCEDCDYSAVNASVLRIHESSDRHMRRATSDIVQPHCDACDRDFDFPSQLGEHQKLQWHIRNQAIFDGIPLPEEQLTAAEIEKKEKTRAHNEQQKAATKIRQSESRAAELYKCHPCGVNCRDAASLRLHCTKPRHQKTLERGKGTTYKCIPCGKEYKYPSDLRQHVNTSKTHQKLAGTAALHTSQ